MGSLPKSADIIIIGGGLAGCTTAYYLAKGGMDVILVEARSICSGATGRMMGAEVQVTGREVNEERSRLWSQYVFGNHKLLGILEKELETDLEYRRVGALDIATSDEDWEEEKHVIELQKMAGDNEVELVDLEQIRKRFTSVFGDIVRGARYRASDGQISPFKLTFSLANGAVRFGAKIFTETKVLEILKKGSRAIGVKTDKGVIYANDWVINASSAWSNFLVPELDILPVKTMVGVTEQVPLKTLIPFESEVDGGWVFGSQAQTGNLIFGTPGGSYTLQGHLDESVSRLDLNQSIESFMKIIPIAKDISVIRVWSGTMAFTQDFLPHVGPMPDIENLFINTGYFNGIPWCPICGKLAAEYILFGGKTSLSIEPFNPGRFAGKKYTWPAEYEYTEIRRLISGWID